MKKQKIILDVTNKIADKDIPIYIVDHSLGGWNGAHLSQILADKGYKIKILVTLDPVGVGTIVRTISSVYFGTPNPKAIYGLMLLLHHKNTEGLNEVSLGKINIVSSIFNGADGYLLWRDQDEYNVTADFKFDQMVSQYVYLCGYNFPYR